MNLILVDFFFRLQGFLFFGFCYRFLACKRLINFLPMFFFHNLFSGHIFVSKLTLLLLIDLVFRHFFLRVFFCDFLFKSNEFCMAIGAKLKLHLCVKFCVVGTICATCTATGCPFLMIIALFQSIHSMFMRTVPAYSEQALVMLDIVSHFGWSRIAVLATNDVDGRNFISNMWPATQRRNIKVDPYFPFEVNSKYTDSY